MNKNLQSPNKFKIILHRFPHVEFFAQTVNLPGMNSGTPQRFTNKGVDYWLTGDKLFYNDLNISFILDEDLKTFKEISDWLNECVKTSEKDVQPYSDIDIHFLTNNSTPNLIITAYNTFPYTIGDAILGTNLTEDSPIVIDVTFKLSHFDIKTAT